MLEESIELKNNIENKTLFHKHSCYLIARPRIVSRELSKVKELVRLLCKKIFNNSA